MKDLDFMCTVIEDYIYHRKNKRVVIKRSPRQIILIYQAYNHAIQWFQQHKVN